MFGVGMDNHIFAVLKIEKKVGEIFVFINQLGALNFMHFAINHRLVLEFGWVLLIWLVLVAASVECQ